MEPYLPNYLKGKNRRLVFDLLRERGQMSRAEITRDTGMSFPTAMKVVDAFLEKGLLVLTAGPGMRLLPPLVISQEEMDQGLEILKKTLS